MEDKRTHDTDDDNDDPSSILKESEHYIRKMLIIQFGSIFLTLGVTGFGIPVYLDKEFNASTSVIGISAALELIVSGIRPFAIPYFATNYPQYLSYDITATMRLFLSTILAFVFCIANDMYLVIICAILSQLLCIQIPTVQGCISLLIPATHAAAHTTQCMGVGILAFLLSTITTQLPFDLLFYISLGMHALLFVFALAFVWKKEQALVAKQMKYYDASFYTELKRREVQNTKNKYRRRSSVANSIIQYLGQNHDQIDFKYDQTVEFPVYQIEARKVLEKDVSSKEHQMMKLSQFFIKEEWILLGCAFTLEAICCVTVFATTKYGMLYLKERYEDEYDESYVKAIGGFMLLASATSSLTILILYPFLFKAMKKILDEELVVHASLLTLPTLMIITSLVWNYAVAPLHFGWVFYWTCGMIAIASLISKITIMSIKSEKYEATLIGMAKVFALFVSAPVVVLIGVIGIESYLFVFVCSGALLIIVMWCIVVTARKLPSK
eukprot:244649_1